MNTTSNATQNRQKTQKAQNHKLLVFSKESLESADLHKPALSILTGKKHPKIKL